MAKAKDRKSAPTIEGAAEEVKKTRRRTSAPDFIRQVIAEGRKVTWTTRNETLISTAMVLVMVAIMAVFFLVVDQILRFGVSTILSL